VKKSKKQQTSAPPAAAKRGFNWWPWLVALGALLLLFEVYGPAIDGPFLFDDRYLPFFAPQLQNEPLINWVLEPRALLMFSFWVDHARGGVEPHGYHVTNLVLHFLVSLVLTLIVKRLLEIGPVSVDKRVRAALAVFAGAVFLVHPLQTESVAYVASRSETLSVLLYFSSYCVFLYKDPDKSISIPRALAVVFLFGGAIASKEHTLTLPALILLTDLAWIRRGWKKNLALYAVLVGLLVVGAVYVQRTLARADTAGFYVRDLSPLSYFSTQCRVLWDYIRLFVVPVGLNADPDIRVSTGLSDPWALAGLAGLAAMAGAAWYFRKQWPLVAFGFAVFLLLLAPTSSFIPIRDVLAERRMYLPMLGALLIVLDLLRRLSFERILIAGLLILPVFGVLTYQRAKLWGSPVDLWQDTVEKSPNKLRPRFQLAHAHYEVQQCAQSASDYQAAYQIGPPEYTLLVDWALALECEGRSEEALQKLNEAVRIEHNNAHAFTQIGMIYGKHGKKEQALAALDEAEKVDPGFAIIYVYRGNIAEIAGDCHEAIAEYKKALSIEPNNVAALPALARASASCR
jgi:tetratricopeptide (TPR) repeat protein